MFIYNLECPVYLSAQKFYLLDLFHASLLQFTSVYSSFCVFCLLSIYAKRYASCFVFACTFLVCTIDVQRLAVEKEIEETMHNIGIKIPYNNNNNNVSDDNIDNMPLF